MKNYEFIEHTADVGIRVYGKDLKSLFKNVAVALFSLIVEFSHQPDKDQERIVRLEAETYEDLLINWLNELISVFFTYKFLPKSYNINISEGLPRLEARLTGAIYDPYSKPINMEIKAATYHNLKIERDSQGFRAEIIFDV